MLAWFFLQTVVPYYCSMNSSTIVCKFKTAPRFEKFASCFTFSSAVSEDVKMQRQGDKVSDYGRICLFILF